ncbi:MAG: LXG domain-containing protein [Streptococcaceae bacterium]|nr:LXG domain-containing protein [Streptococcaceae bacterium]
MKVYIEKEVSLSDMVRIDINEINRMLDAGNQLASENDELQRELSYLRSFSEESQLTGQAWGGAKSVSADAYIPLVQGKIAYNEAVISGNKKVRRAVEAFRYGTPLDEQDLVNTLNGYSQSRNDYQEMIREINYNEMTDPLMSSYYENLR